MSGGGFHESWRFRGKGWVSSGGRAWRARDTQGEIRRGKGEKSVLTERVAERGVRVLLDGGVVLDDALDLDEGCVVLATLLWLNEHRLPVARRGLEAVPAPLLDLANEAHLAAHVPLHDVKVHPRGRLAAVHSAFHLVASPALRVVWTTVELLSTAPLGSPPPAVWALCFGPPSFSRLFRPSLLLSPKTKLTPLKSLSFKELLTDRGHDGGRGHRELDE